MLRLGAPIACGAFIWLAIGSTCASAASTSGLAVATVAARLADVIRHDARQVSRHSRAAVTVTRRCCGQRVLRVHYTLKPNRRVTSDTYVLRLETRRGVVQGVGVFQSTREMGTEPGGGHWQGSREYAFVIHHRASGSNRGWAYRLSYGDVFETMGNSREPPKGLGSARECNAPGTVPRALYDVVLSMIEHARQGDATPPSPFPFSYCRRP